MAEQDNSVFRKKALDRIAAPDQLTDYLRVTNPGVWALLTAVILLLAGIFAWSMVGVLETTADAVVIVEGETASIAAAGQEKIEEGMPLRIAGEEYKIVSVRADEYGRTVGYAQVDLPDGTYEGKVVTQKIHPVAFLMESR